MHATIPASMSFYLYLPRTIRNLHNCEGTFLSRIVRLSLFLDIVAQVGG